MAEWLARLLRIRRSEVRSPAAISCSAVIAVAQTVSYKLMKLISLSPSRLSDETLNRMQLIGCESSIGYEPLRDWVIYLILVGI